MIKEEIAPGIVVYSNVIPDSENLYKDIEEGMISANIQWQGARVKEGNGEGDTLNTTTRDTQTIGVPYQGKINTVLLSQDPQAVFYDNLNNLFFEYFGKFPSWYQWLIVGIFGAIYGLKPTLDIFKK